MAATTEYLRRLLLKEQPRLAQVRSTYLGLSEKKRRIKKTNHGDGNWNEYPFNHHMDAPGVEDLNPSRNFQVDLSILQATYLTMAH